MDWLTFIFVVLLLFSLTDFMWPGQQKLHKQLYELAFFVTYFLFTIKYYYGADIATYVPVYENIESPQVLLAQGSKYGSTFEFGYLLFCSVLHHMGVSFWLMTAIISTFYFYAIHKLFKLIPSKRIFALLILVILDYNLMFAAYRQCIAVGFFILMVLAYADKKYIRVAVYFVIISFVHKSGLYISAMTLATLAFFGNTRIARNNYWLLGVVLTLLCVISTREFLLLLTGWLPLPGTTAASIVHHLSQGKRVQLVFVVYFVAICLVALYLRSDKSTQRKKLQWVVFLGLFMIVCLYQYYYLLNRLRSYFLPFIIAFIFNQVYSKEPLVLPIKNVRLLGQSAVMLIYLIFSYYIVSWNVSHQKLVGRIYEASTVFDRLNDSEAAIKKRQLHKAELYWTVDVQKLLKQNDISH